MHCLAFAGSYLIVRGISHYLGGWPTDDIMNIKYIWDGYDLRFLGYIILMIPIAFVSYKHLDKENVIYVAELKRLAEEERER
jgi:hypothetical protein